MPTTNITKHYGAADGSQPAVLGVRKSFELLYI